MGRSGSDILIYMYVGIFIYIFVFALVFGGRILI